MSLESKVRELRRGRGLKQSELAEALHFSMQTISRIERGVWKGSYDVIEALADFFGVSPDWLMDKRDDSWTSTPDAAIKSEEDAERKALERIRADRDIVSDGDMQMMIMDEVRTLRGRQLRALLGIVREFRAGCQPAEAEAPEKNITNAS